MQFTELLNLLLEAEYSYQIPTDKEKLLFDFYTLEAIDKYPQIEGGMWEIRDYFNERQAIKYIKEKLLPHLKEELLDAAFFAIAAEFRHAIPWQWQMDLEDAYSEGQVTNVKRLMRQYPAVGKVMQNFSANWPEKASPKTSLHKDAAPDRLRALEAAEASTKTRKDFVEAAKTVFEKGWWEDEYGGEPWADIAKAWLNLEKGKPEDLYIWIDQMFSAQHNSGSMLNKLQTYKIGKDWKWLKAALDFKFDVDNPWKLYQKASRDLQRLGAAVLYAKGYGSAENFWKKSYKSGDVEALSPTVVTTTNQLLKGLKQGFQSDLELNQLIDKYAEELQKLMDDRVSPVYFTSESYFLIPDGLMSINDNTLKAYEKIWTALAPKYKQHSNTQTLDFATYGTATKLIGDAIHMESVNPLKLLNIFKRLVLDKYADKDTQIGSLWNIYDLLQKLIDNKDYSIDTALSILSYINQDPNALDKMIKRRQGYSGQARDEIMWDVYAIIKELPNETFMELEPFLARLGVLD